MATAHPSQEKTFEDSGKINFLREIDGFKERNSRRLIMTVLYYRALIIRQNNHCPLKIFTLFTSSALQRGDITQPLRDLKKYILNIEKNPGKKNGTLRRSQPFFSNKQLAFRSHRGPIEQL